MLRYYRKGLRTNVASNEILEIGKALFFLPLLFPLAQAYLKRV